jgi:hypothetical protein
LRKNILISILFPLFTCLFVFGVSCIPSQTSAGNTSVAKTSTDDPVAAARQKIVNDLSKLPAGYTTPNISYNTPDSARLDDWFDVNEYFTVLTHLSIEPGYVLEYLYHSSGSDAQPYLYVRKIDSPPYSTFAELIQTYNDGAYIDPTKKHSYDYLAYIRTDGTEEAFFDYVLLRIMGGQFYLWWHAQYNDHVIICDQTGLDGMLSDVNSYSSRFGQTLPVDVQNQARNIDFSPTVETGIDKVIVKVVVFTKWGGFIEETYTISREFPHIITDIKTKTLVPWNINLTF